MEERFDPQNNQILKVAFALWSASTSVCVSLVLSARSPTSMALSGCSKAILTSARSYSTIGVVGLGNMGAPMAVNLAKRNRVLAFDRDEKTRARMQRDFQVVGHLTDVLSADTVLTMLPGPESCLEVYCGDNGLLR